MPEPGFGLAIHGDHAFSGAQEVLAPSYNSK
jgi:hypothetical protein